MNPILSSSKKSKFFVALLLLSSLAAFNTASATKEHSANDELISQGLKQAEEPQSKPTKKTAPQTAAQNSNNSPANSSQQPETPPQNNIPVQTENTPQTAQQSSGDSPANSPQQPTTLPEQQNPVQPETVATPMTTKLPNKALLYTLLGLLAAFAVVLLTLLVTRRPVKMKNIDIPNIPDDKNPEPTLATDSPLSEWLIVDHSAIGKDHIKKGTPCQDSRYIERINSQWGVAVCCDGAGSKVNSHIGSKFVAEQTAKMLAFGIKAEQWHTNQQLPRAEAWREMAIQVLNEVNLRLGRYAQEQNLAIDSLGCTVIVVVYSPIGLLVAHIGDGRAAYCNKAGKWQAIMTPFQGEYAGETVFITTSYVWNKTDDFIETQVINDKPFGFTLMSDGCESFAFTTKVNTAENAGELKLVPVNEPFVPFYTYAVSNLKDFHKKNDSHAAIQADWARILEEGSETIKHEPDDKTMILAILV